MAGRSLRMGLIVAVPPSLCLSEIIEIAVGASHIVRSYYDSSSLAVRLKADTSPVTSADEAANRFITHALRERFPQRVISEEESSEEPIIGDEFWLVDPLDGTKDFLARNGEFTVNIALVRDRRPVLGVVAIPALRMVYFSEEGKGAYRASEENLMPSSISNSRTGPPTIGLESRCHPSHETVELYASQGIPQVLRVGSSLKLCRIAEGEADIYIRFAGTSEWDTAAGHAILREAGCELIDLTTGKELEYGKPRLRNSSIAAGRSNCLNDVLTRACVLHTNSASRR